MDGTVRIEPGPDPNAWLDLVLLPEFQRSPDRLMPLRVRNYVDCHHLDAWRQRDRDGYLLLDIHRLGADDFRDDNAVSQLAELTNPRPTRRTAKLAASLLEVLAGEQPELRQVLFEWIRQESGLDFGVAGDGASGTPGRIRTG